MEMDQLQTQIQPELPFCRLCFSQDCELYELFPGAGNDNESLLLKILEVLAIPISFDDDLNSFICGKCVTTVEDFYEYKEKVKENDVLLREKRKSVEHATAIYNVVSMQPDATNSSSSVSNGATCADGSGGGGGCCWWWCCCFVGVVGSGGFSATDTGSPWLCWPISATT